MPLNVMKTFKAFNEFIKMSRRFLKPATTDIANNCV